MTGNKCRTCGNKEYRFHGRQTAEIGTEITYAVYSCTRCGTVTTEAKLEREVSEQTSE